MKDAFGKDLITGDIIKQRFDENVCPKNSEWIILGFGIEPSTNKKVAVIKSIDKEYILCSYQSELKHFYKKTDLIQ